MEKLDAGDQLSELLEKQRLERVAQIDIMKDELFTALCNKHDKELKEFLNII